MWEINLSWQIQGFLWSLVFGFAFCVVFDIITIIEEQLNLSKISVYLLDLLYFLFLAIFDFCLFLVFCNGEIRGFVFIGELLGFVLCKITASKIYVPLMLIIFSLVKRLLLKLKKHFVKPVSSFFTKIFKKAEKLNQKRLEKV